MLRRHIILLIAIRPSDGDVKPGGPLGAFREEQAMSRHRVSPSAFLSSSSRTTHLHYKLVLKFILINWIKFCYIMELYIFVHLKFKIFKIYLYPKVPLVIIVFIIIRSTSFGAMPPSSGPTSLFWVVIISQMFKKFQPNNIWEIITTQNKDVGPEDGGIPAKLVDRIIINTIMTNGTLGYK